MTNNNNNKPLINLTPHDIHVYLSETEKTTIPRSSKVARVRQAPAVQCRELHSEYGLDKPVSVMQAPVFLGVEWPDFEFSDFSGVVVSMVVGQAVQKMPASERPPVAVFGPDTSPSAVIRDQEGQIKGVTRLLAYHLPGDETE